jgi:predicted DNA-binding transcriptional regulator AlpA
MKRQSPLAHVPLESRLHDDAHQRAGQAHTARRRTGETKEALRVTLNELLEHPNGIVDLPPADLARTLSQLAALHLALAAHVREMFPPIPAGAADRLLTVGEVAQRLSISSHAVYRRASSFPFTVRVGRYLRFSERGLDEYLESRRGR